MESRARVIVVSLEQSRIELQRFPELGFGLPEVAANEKGEPARRMRFGEFRRELECALARLVRLARVHRIRVDVHYQERMAVGITCPREREVGIDIERLPEHLPRVLDIDFVKALEELPPSQVVVVRIDVRARHRTDSLPLLLGYGCNERLGDACRNFVLDGEDVFEIFVELL